MDKHRITKVLFIPQEPEELAEKIEPQTKVTKSRSWFASWSSKHKNRSEAQAVEGGVEKEPEFGAPERTVQMEKDAT